MTTISRPRMPGEVRRAKLLELARTTFIASGYHATTTRAIAEEAGISETLVLKHFRSKEELFRAAVVQPFFELLDRAGNKLDEYARTGRVLSVEDRFRVVLGFFSTWAAIVREERQLIVALVSELRQFPDVAADLQKRTDRIIRAGLPTPAAETGLRDFDRNVSLLSGLAVATMAGWVGDDPRAFLEEFLRTWYVGLLTESGQRKLLKPADLAQP
jgi:AcrR family transcriptional regulator